MRFNALSKNQEPKVDLDVDQRLGLWRSRPWQHRALYRWNVLTAYARGVVSARHLWDALLNPHQVIMLPFRAPQRGMIFVCPAAAREYREMCESDTWASTKLTRELEGPEQPTGARDIVSDCHYCDPLKSSLF